MAVTWTVKSANPSKGIGFALMPLNMNVFYG